MIDKNMFFEVYRKVGSNINYLDFNDYSDIYTFIGFSKEKDIESGKSMDKLFDAIRFFMNEEGVSFNKSSFDVFNPNSRVYSKYLVLYPSEYSYYLDIFDTKSLFDAFYKDGIDVFIYSFDGDYSLDKGYTNSEFGFRYYGNANYLGKYKKLDKVLKLKNKES